jgi:hypothetical protein
MNDLAQRLLQIARQCAVSNAEIVRLSRHPCLIGTHNGRPIKYASPGSPSDWRSARNTIAQFYRYLGVPKPRKSRQNDRTSHRSRMERKRSRRNRVSWELSRNRVSRELPFMGRHQNTPVDSNPFEVLASLRPLLVASNPTSSDGESS